MLTIQNLMVIVLKIPVVDRLPLTSAGMTNATAESIAGRGLYDAEVDKQRHGLSRNDISTASHTRLSPLAKHKIWCSSAA